MDQTAFVIRVVVLKVSNFNKGIIFYKKKSQVSIQITNLSYQETLVIEWNCNTNRNNM